MILKEEIDKKAEEFEIHTSNVQRDYIFGWFLFGVFTTSDIKDQIFLKGGNAIRKGYFANTRFSNDLDFGITGDIEKEILKNEINKVCDFIKNSSGINFLTEETKLEEKFTATESPLPDLKVYEARIYFSNFYGKSEHLRIRISMDFTRFDKTLLPLQSVKLIHPYSDYEKLECEIKCMKLEEIIATKLKCLLQRQHAPDLFDYVQSIKILGGELNKEEIIKICLKKTIFEKSPHTLKNILLEMPFEYFKEYWAKTIICAKAISIDVNEAIQFFLSDLEILFSFFSGDSYYQYDFYGPNLRNPIMKAGREQTILKVIYNGEARKIEPYSLKYMTRKDGKEKEYLYVYNLEGGSSYPGIRCFIASNFQSIENTEEKFTPKYQIELSKAGETPENKYLFDPNKPTKVSSRLFGKNFSKIKYFYKCSVCGKKFTKKTMDSTIGKHKNKNGFECYGNYGIYITTKY